MSMDPMAMSPKTQGMSMQNSGARVEDLFNQGFQQLAYDAFVKAFPDLLENVVTLKVLDSDPDTGTAIGTFILDMQQEIFYVPAIISNNECKPFDIFYSRRTDRYYPLNHEWLAEASKSAIGQMGTGIQTPKDLQTDVDIRNLVVPPMTGRYSYAQAVEPECWVYPLAADPDMRKLASEDLGFTSFIASAPSALKTAALRFFNRNPDVLERATAIYGVSAITQAFNTDKTASSREIPMVRDPYGKVLVADKDTSSTKLKEMFGEEAGLAYSTIRSEGFYAKDTRKQTGKVIEFETTEMAIEEPTTTGLYKVFLTTGDAEEAFVLVNPVKLDGWGGPSPFNQRNLNGKRNYTDIREHSADVYPPSRPARKKYFLVKLKDGRWACVQHLLAQRIPATHEECEKFLGSGGSPRHDELGIFVSTEGHTIKGTDEVRVYKTTTGKGGRLVCETASLGNIVVDPDMTGKTIMFLADQQNVVLPKSFKWHKLGQRLMLEDFMLDPGQIFKQAERRMKTAGAVKISIQARNDGYRVGRGGESLTLPMALKTAAELYDIALDDAQELLMRANINGSVGSAWAIKTAGPQDGGGAPPPGDPGMDPAMAGMMGPPMPPPPSSLELAVGEQLQQLQQQSQALQAQMQALQMVAMRAQQIEMSGAGVMAAPLAASFIAPPPAQQPPAPAGPAPDPTMQQAQPGMPPQGGPQGMGQPQQPPVQMQPSPPGMNPYMMGSANGGQVAPQDPMAGAGGISPGVDPMQMSAQMGQPPPMALMKDKALTADNVYNSINPQFLQNAADLDQAHVFDAAAIASLSGNRRIFDLTKNYLPIIERALDNLGRVLLLFYMKENLITKQVGNEEYAVAEQKIQDVFRGLGDALLKLNQFSQLPPPDASEMNA